MYEIGDAARALEDFIEDLSRWYIRRSRKRTEALPVLRTVLFEVSKLMAPFTPFFAEALFLSLRASMSERGNLSVHLEDWPKADKTFIDHTLLDGMAEVRRLASLGLAARAESKIKVRQPLATFKIKMQNAKIKINEELLEILKDEVNVKEIVFEVGLGQEVLLNTIVTPALRDEGLYRELVRMVQGLRHTAAYAPQEKARVFIDGDAAIKQSVESRREQFMVDVNAKEIIFGKIKIVDAEAKENFDGSAAHAGISH